MRNLYKYLTYNTTMANENKWNYMIALGCIVGIVFMTYFVLNNANTAVASNSDTAGQVYSATDANTDTTLPTTGLQVSHPDTDASKTYAYLDSTR